MSDKTTYESLDNRIAPEALTKDHTKGLAVIDGHAVKSQEDYEDPDRLYDILIARIRKYHPSTDVSLIEKAYKLAVEAHGDQRRKSGEPYIIHPLWVAIILADLEMDKETIAAGMLHDVVEDTKFTEEDIRKEFGAEVALLVDGVTKRGKTFLFFGINWRYRQVKFKKDVPGNGKGHPGYHYQTRQTVCIICVHCSL